MFMINYGLFKIDLSLLYLTNLIKHNFTGHFELKKHD